MTRTTATAACVERAVQTPLLTQAQTQLQTRDLYSGRFPPPPPLRFRGAPDNDSRSRRGSLARPAAAGW